MTGSGAMCVLLGLLSACGRLGYAGDEASLAPDATPNPAVVQPCSPEVDDLTVALYSFTSDSGTNALIDTAGDHSGITVEGAAAGVGGPPGCGTGLDFRPGYAGVLPDSPAWDLPVGSISYWLFLDELPESMAGVVSRDAMQTDLAGHLTFWISPEGVLGVRLQSDAEMPENDVMCAREIPLEQWVHVAFNFGPPRTELFINGVSRQDSGGIPFATQTVTCGTTAPIGIDGNNNPWTLGLSSDQSVEGEAEPASRPLNVGAIDNLRISREQRDYSRFQP